MVFVSYQSGVELREYINTQPEDIKSEGGPRILIDGSDHWVFPPMDESAAGLAFLLMLFGCVCSLSLFLNTTFYSGRSTDGSEHNLFLLDPRQGNATAGNNRGRGRGNGLRLLTMEEVETLPTREYCSPGNSSGDEEASGGSSSSPPNSSLELRDKSDMPYLADEENGNEQRGTATAAGQNLNGNHDEGDSSTTQERGGGLCESLLPTTCKGKDPDDYDIYFNHNTCSICLDEYDPGEQVRVLPCQHTFHSDCIFPWLTERSPTCPLCKAMFEAVQYEEEEGEADGEEGDDQEGEADDDEESREEGAEQQEGEEEQTVPTEAGTSPQQPPPLEEEPPIHRRRQRRRQQRQREERQSDRESRRRSRRDLNTDAIPASATAAATTEETNEEARNEAGGGPEAAIPSSSEERSSSGLRGRFWGLFGSSAATPATTSALEEPLLAEEDDGNDGGV